MSGNPLFAATFVGESANGVARDIAAGLYRTTFVRKMFAYWRRASARRPGKRAVE